MSLSTLTSTFVYRLLSASSYLMSDSTTLTRPAALGNPPRIYPDEEPQDGLYPCVVYQDQGSADLNALGLVRVMTTQLLNVRIIGQTANAKDLDAIEYWVDVILHGRNYVPVDGHGSMLSCQRLSQMRLPSTVNGVRYTALVNLYQIQAQETRAIGGP